MVRGSVTNGGIGIGSALGQDGRTIDNEIASADEMAPHGTPDREHEERLKRRRSCGLPAFAQLGRAGDARVAIGSQWQAISQGQSWPTLEPVMHIPGRDSRHSILSKAIRATTLRDSCGGDHLLL